MKKTSKGKIILNLFKDGELLNANEICTKLPDIDRATVYRNLNKFVENNILREIHLSKLRSTYELLKENDHHQHFICTNCEKIIPVNVSIDLITKIQPKGTNLENFELNIKGTCKNCN